MFTENLQQFNPIGTPEGIKYNGESYRVTNTCAQPVDVALAMAGIYEIRRRHNYPITTPANLLFVPNFLVDEGNGVTNENAGAVYAPSFDLFVFATDNIHISGTRYAKFVINGFADNDYLVGRQVQSQ